MSYSLLAATTPRRVERDSFEVDIDSSWNVILGPNGGLVTAALVRTAQQRFGLPVRSLTAHFMRPPVGPLTARLTTREIRSGRTITTAAVELWAHDKLCVTSLLALGPDRPSAEFDDSRRSLAAMPIHWPPAAFDTDVVPFRRYWSIVPTLGRESPAGHTPSAPATQAIAGGWMRPSSGERVDAAAAAAALDGWWPALFNVMADPGPVPTIDLTVHFRRAIDCEAVFIESRTVLLADGYLDEDARVWSPDGRLLAQSRQLAAAFQPTRSAPVTTGGRDDHSG